METIEAERPYSVYKHTFPDGSYYYGITRQEPKERWGYGHGYLGQRVHDAIDEFGWDSVVSDVLVSGLTEEEAKIVETCLITSTRSTEFGHNDVEITSGDRNAIIRILAMTLMKLSERLYWKEWMEKQK